MGKPRGDDDVVSLPAEVLGEAGEVGGAPGLFRPVVRRVMRTFSAVIGCRWMPMSSRPAELRESIQPRAGSGNTEPPSGRRVSSAAAVAHTED